MDLKSDEAFFEELANRTRVPNPETTPEPGANGWKIELAKAVTAAARKTTAAPKERVKAASPESESEGQLTIDVYQTPHEIVVQSAVAGIRPEDLDIDVTNDSVTVRGERKQEHSVSEEDYIYRECYWGRFSRSIILPEEIDAENASVTFKNGVLSIHLPKLKKQSAKKLKVKFE